MLPEVIETEHQLDTLLPPQRLETSPSAGLINAAVKWSRAVWRTAEQAGPMPLTDEEIREGLSLSQRPVFVCGVHRSGTTLLRNLLDGHPDLVVLPSEGTYYTNLEFKLNSLPENEKAAFLGMEWLRRLANPINQLPYWLLGRSSDFSSPYVDFARYFMAWQQHVREPHIAIMLAYASCTGNLNARLWVDKTPTNERFLTRIWQEMPEAKIVHIVRDPVATITSRKKMESSLDLRRALLDLKMSYTVAVAQLQLGDSGYLCIRYEDLCENPPAVIKMLTSFLDIKITDELGIATVAGIPVSANSVFADREASGQILKAHQHRQDKMLSKNEQELLAAYVGSLANKLNYTMARPKFMKRFFIRLKYRFSAPLGG
ncbi:MAG TPA: sulfotransferase [Mucilaginibacter sp.]|nr:sulfotransferase [Mucilaginibacter sp.]